MLPNSRNLLRLAASTALVAGLAAVSSARADVVFDNLAAASDFSEAVLGDGPLAQSFNSTNGGLLHDVQLELTSASPLIGTIQVTLVADNGNTPGSTIVSLGTLSSSQVSTSSNQTFDFAPTATTFLAADTNYWIELSSLTPNGIEWLGSDDTSGLGVDGSFISVADAGTFPSDGNVAFQMAVDVPEPGTVALFMSGILGLMLLRRRARGF
jgi:hypothetical protein